MQNINVFLAISNKLANFLLTMTKNLDQPHTNDRKIKLLLPGLAISFRLYSESACTLTIRNFPILRIENLTMIQ